MPHPFPSNLFSSSTVAHELCIKLPPNQPNSRPTSPPPINPPLPSAVPAPSPIQLRSVHLTTTMSQPVIPPMPACRDCRAPQFDWASGTSSVLWGAQIPLWAIFHSQQDSNEEACSAICWLQHRGTLGNSSWVHKQHQILPGFHWLSVQTVPWIGLWATMVNSRYGQVSRGDVVSRHSVSHRFRKIS